MALSSTTIGTSNQTVYTSSGSNAITSIIVCNYSVGTTSNFTLYAVPASGGNPGTAGNANMIINALTIPPGETVSLDQEKLVLGNNDTLVALSSQATTLNIVISTLAV